MYKRQELKLLVDAVQSSKFITVKKSRKLIKKLESLASVSEAKQLQRNVYITNRNKTLNESIYYNVDKIHDAILSDAKIRFVYYKWNTDKELIPRNNGNPFVVSPWALTWDDENYYLLAYDGESGIVKHYRVDKMRSIGLLKGKMCIRDRTIRSLVTGVDRNPARLPLSTFSATRRFPVRMEYTMGKIIAIRA